MKNIEDRVDNHENRIVNLEKETAVLAHEVSGLTKAINQMCSVIRWAACGIIGVGVGFIVFCLQLLVERL